MNFSRKGLAYSNQEFVGLFGFTLLIYVAFLNAWYFADDFQLVFSGADYSIFDHFTKKSPNNQFYRPFQNAYLSATQAEYGIYLTWPVHLVHLVLHTFLGFLVIQFARYCGCSRGLAFLGGLFTVAIQGSVHSLISNDTLSQVGGTVLGYTALWLLLLGLERNKIYLALSVMVFTTALFFKETSISFMMLIPLLGVTLVFRPFSRKAYSDRTSFLALVHRVIMILCPYVLAFLVYFLIRKQIVTSSFRLGSGLYDFNFGINIARNFAQLMLALVSPVSTVLIIKAMYAHAWGALLVYLLPLFTLFGFSLYTLVSWRGLASGAFFLVVWLFVVFCSFVPVVFLNHVSELYVYNATPLFVLALVLLIRSSKHQLFRVVVYGCLLLNAVSAFSKAQMMYNNGERARRVVENIVSYGTSLPLSSTITLIANPDPKRLNYSVFLVGANNLITSNFKILSMLMNRSDITVRPEAKAHEDKPEHEFLALVSDDGEVEFRAR